MDANLQQAYLLSDAADWALQATPALLYDPRARVLRLASARQRVIREDEAAARARLNRVPHAIDRFGTRARWDAASHRVLASGARGAADEVAIYTAAPGWPVTDLGVGSDDVLYMLAGGRLVLQDLRKRWETVDRLVTEGFTGWRLAPAPGGGVYVLDRVFRHIARTHGLPMRVHRAIFDPGVFRPDPEDPDPPGARVLKNALIPDDEQPVAIACSPEGKLALLTWVNGEDARLRVLDEHERFGEPQILVGVRFPFSLAWLSEERVGVLIATLERTGLEEALVYPRLAPARSAAGRQNPAPLRRSLAVGDIHPLREHTGGPFLHGPGAPAFYPSTRGALPLQPLVWPSFAELAEVRCAAALDSGSARTVWHRLYLEAAIPKSCGIRALLAATDEAVLPEDVSAIEWHEHHFGAVPESSTPEVPRGAWMRERSEIALHPGLLPCPSKADEAGLFTVLIQRAGRRVRSLSGRYLWVRLELRGDGRSTPEIAAVRAYASRRSYALHLPELYRESLFGPRADEEGESTRPDFLERYLGLFESVFTPLEDRIAGADRLSDPRTTPEQALEWLAGWIGFGFSAGVPTERRRALLARAPDLYRQRATLAGLELAIDLATGGACSRGQVVVVEDFRLRRTFATILGADLADEADPLLAGLVFSGSSFVGDTLLLGDEERREFLAVFTEGIERDRRERDAVAALFDALAFRVTVLVHQEVEAQDLGLIRSIAALETPAYIELKVVTASERFLVGVSSLIGVDSFLARRPEKGPVRVDQSAVGRRDWIEHLPSLDPRLDRPSSQEQT